MTRKIEQVRFAVDAPQKSEWQPTPGPQAARMLSLYYLLGTIYITLKGEKVK